MGNLNHTLEERGKRYGEFRDNARVAQELKKVFWSEPRDVGVPAYMREGIDQILSKLSRIAVGDMTYADNFTDIAGYATLIEKELMKMENEPFANSLVIHFKPVNEPFANPPGIYSELVNAKFNN